MIYNQINEQVDSFVVEVDVSVNFNSCKVNNTACNK